MPMRPPQFRPLGAKSTADRQRAAERARPTARQRGYTVEWQRRSAAFLARPENRRCACGCGEPATVVDHIKPHRGDPALFWDERNWQGMAKRHHDSKTAREDGGFGRRRPAR